MNRSLRRLLRWLGVTLLILWLLARLALLMLDETELRLNLRAGEASAEMTLGGLHCRKEVQGSWPFVTLRCGPRESSSALQPAPSP